MLKKHKLVLAGGLVFILMVLLIFQFTKALEARIIEIEPQTLVNSFMEQGTIIPRLERPLYIQTTQEVLELLVFEGQEVSEGEPLAILSIQELDIELRKLQIQRTNLLLAREASLKNSRLQKQEAQMQLNLAQKEYAKLESLYQAGAISRQDLENMESNCELAQINLEKQQETLKLLESNQELEILETQIELLEHKINKTKLLAPIDGIVARINIKEGDLAPLNQPLMTIFQKDDYLLEAFVPESDARLLQNNMKVLIRDEQNSQDIDLEGYIRSIAPSTVTQISPLGLEEERVKVLIDIALPPESKLFAGAKLDLEFITALEEDALVVPKTVLFPYENQQALWVVRKDRASIQTVEKGLASNYYVVIKEGLREKDKVIENPQLKGLKPGKRIKAIP